MPASRPTRRTSPAILATAVCLALTAGSPAVADTARFQEPYRPQVHYTPAQNWMNDPNGLVYDQGEYHLFYQYNPNGNSWGDMSWGHAVSTDLVHWKELPPAIPRSDDEMVFSGSVVVDTDNTSGLGTRANPAMVAVYTSAYTDGRQAQSLAHSTDRGRTWTKYAGNPVLDIGSHAFRDPKVQWYAPTRSWLMTVSLADEHKVQFYTSKDLKSWALLSEFGPAGATGGAWECPDFFPLAVDGDPQHVKWVMVVNLNPGGIAGGSGAQYFVGDFDGTTFTPDDDGSYTPPSGTVVQGFEEGGYGTWTTGGTAFGTGPATGSLPGQSAITGFEGGGYANSFHDGDGATGTLTSPAFTATSDYLNFKVGGGNHPHNPNAVTDPQPTPTGTVLADFEGDTYGDWTTTGTAFGTGPAQGTLPGQMDVSGYTGHGLANSFLQGDTTTGTLTSPTFTIDKKYLDFLIGGGAHPAGSDSPTTIELVVDGKTVRSATGSNDEHLDWVSWDLSDLQGKTARIRIVDQNTGGWGHINVDRIVLSDTRAKPRSSETAVNLVVDGRVVQSATGSDSETLDWASFDLRPHKGKQARIQIADLNTGGWGHIMADQFTAADQPALSTLQRAHWVDFGKDFYAAVTYNDAPRGERTMIGWMSNWQYAGNTPTTPWRSAQSLPRTLQLRTVDGRLRLTQQPVRSLNTLRRGPAVALNHATVPAGTTALPSRSTGKALDVDAVFSPADAKTFGLKVRTGPGQETVIGYDTANQRLYVDRTRSGAVDFDPDFPGIQTAPLKPQEDGRIHIRVVADWSSVEVFGGQGEAVITDQVFPDPGSQGVQLFAEGGSARLDTLTLWHLGSYRNK
ncbi:GH32 C-terminal domain-containing protein [Kitasatospora sp. NPDC001547]|uniref:GH32 C-terminal domain-containing protein n=1 Tax=Kitasatospora sp. NPDC001547 TaxID=3364015 RepID=UPI00367D97C8